MADTLHENKMRFAELLQRYPKEQRAQYYSVVAKETIGKEEAAQYPLYVIEISEKWPIDDEVCAEIARRDRILPEREVVLQELYANANNRFYSATERKGFYELYMKGTGMIQLSIKDGPGTNQEVARLQALFGAVQNPADT